MSALTLPRRGRGRQTAVAEAEYQDALDAFCAAILQLQSSLDFKVSSRGWCYILEDHGLAKGDFDAAQNLINDCRKDGNLPFDIVAEDGARAFLHVDRIDTNDPEEEAEWIVDYIERAHNDYQPFSFWSYQQYYVEMLVEKVDLKSLFEPVCSEFRVPLANARGWSDLNLRAAMMQRFKKWEYEGKQCVLLYCGDFDPAGRLISDCLRGNLADLAGAVGWFPDELIIDRFGLNHDFIVEHRLSWINNLETGSSKRLDDPHHPHHRKDYVQNYLQEYGARKVEANALVVRPEAGRDLCRDTILKYIDRDGIEAFETALDEQRDIVAAEVTRQLAEKMAP